MKHEFWNNGATNRWKRLKKLFQKRKRKKISTFYSHVIEEALDSNPANWYSIVKKLGIPGTSSNLVTVECLKGLEPEEAANRVASNFAGISQEYDPISLDKLPSFLPASEPPVLQEYEVYEELKKMKKTKSCLPIDLPYKIRKEFAAELAAPLTNILNSCLRDGKYPFFLGNFE